MKDLRGLCGGARQTCDRARDTTAVNNAGRLAAVVRCGTVAEGTRCRYDSPSVLCGCHACGMLTFSILCLCVCVCVCVYVRVAEVVSLRTDLERALSKLSDLQCTCAVHSQ